jgi:DNA-binding response OmpR family regulator
MKKFSVIAFLVPIINLTPKEFDLLYILVSNQNKVFEREKLLELIWDFNYYGGSRTVDIHIQRLRKKLKEPYCDFLRTVYKVGYKFVGEDIEI